MTDETAEASQPIILIHGFMQSDHSWDEVAQLLWPDHPVYIFDWPGVGPIDAPLPDCSLQAAVKQLDACVRAVTADNPTGPEPVIVGYSQGGRMAASYITELVELFRATPVKGSADALRSVLPFSGVILESAGLGPQTEAQRETLRQRNQEWATMIRHQGLEAFVDYWESLPLFESQRELPESAQRAIRQDRLSQDPELLARQLEKAGPQAMALEERQLCALEEVLESGRLVGYIVGERDERYLRNGERLGQRWAAYPGFHTAVIPSVGHNTHLEAPKSFVEALEYQLRAKA